MLDYAGGKKSSIAGLADFAHLADMNTNSGDAESIRDVMTATSRGVHKRDDWNGNAATRRAAFQIVVRAKQLYPEESWTDAMLSAVAYGSWFSSKHVVEDDRVQAWRGVLLRHQSVGAWRRLWADLVEQVMSAD